LGQLPAGHTPVIYKPDRVARSMKGLLVPLENQPHTRGINLHILTVHLGWDPSPQWGGHLRQDAVHGGCDGRGGANAT
jgi:hypothetical protein